MNNTRLGDTDFHTVKNLHGVDKPAYIKLFCVYISQLKKFFATSEKKVLLFQTSK